MSALRGELYRFELKFKEPAMTSRGTYLTHTVWYPVLHWEGKLALGECAPLPDLSADFLSQGATEDSRLRGYEALLCEHLQALCAALRQGQSPAVDSWRPYSALRFGFECLLQSYTQQQASVAASQDAGAAVLFPSAFTHGSLDLPINGLIWMGSFEVMAQRIVSKLAEGYRCIKLKIGAIDFAQELQLLEQLRSRFSPEQLELRVDANGAFSAATVGDKLKALSAFQLHSIEQPVKAGQWELMAKLCAESPIAIVLDEELIGVNEQQQKIDLLDTIKPQYLILKPSLHGGLSGCEEWINLAKERGIGYWVTSALESNIGLNAIAQWCALQNVTMPQGLGTGLLYTNNVLSPLSIQHAKLHCDLAAVGAYDDYVRKFLASEATLVGSWDI